MLAPGPTAVAMRSGFRGTQSSSDPPVWGSLCKVFCRSRTTQINVGSQMSAQRTNGHMMLQAGRKSRIVRWVDHPLRISTLLQKRAYAKGVIDPSDNAALSTCLQHHATVRTLRRHL